ncbi:MAG: hypothetical protein HOO96_22780 [Polyangiaceae bacterium]|nr:hypothetical protein [Polyangiaceae bacterium]
MIDAYLEIMHGYLVGRESESATADALERAGFSPSSSPVAPSSSPSTFGVYRELVTRQWRAVLDHFFRAARAFALASSRTDDPTWDELALAFHQAHPPTEGNPNVFCLPFAAYLEARGCGAELVELADFAVTRYRAMHVAHGPTPVVEADVFARTYGFDVVSFSRAAEAGEAGCLLAAVPTTVVIGRSRRTGALRVVRASLGALVALSEADGSASSDQLPAGLTRALVESERGALALEGLLP